MRRLILKTLTTLSLLLLGAVLVIQCRQHCFKDVIGWAGWIDLAYLR